ncbi:MAG: hypothetical protein NC120_10225 [Ruminococcus sp.]|nr:hypothetical protein [Ruminococcus sp.]
MPDKKRFHLKRIKTGKFKPKAPLPKSLGYKRLVKENVDYDDKDSVLSVKSTVDAVQGAAAAVHGAKKAVGKAYSGAVKGVTGTRKLVSRVNRMSRTPITSKNVRQIAGRVGRASVTAAKNTVIKGGKTAGRTALGVRDRVLAASIDKSKVTDTGMETINQGITYVRYADNTRRAVINTKRAAVSGIKTSVETARKIKSLPKDTVNTVRRTSAAVRNTAVKTKQTVKAVAEAGKKAASALGKVVTSKAMPVILAGAALIIVVLLLSNCISSVIMMIGGTFSWLDGGNKSDLSNKKQIEKYMEIVSEKVRDEQERIDDVYYGFNCDRVEYEPYREVTAFREERFTYRRIEVDTDEEYKQIIALTAAKWYSDTLLANGETADLKLKKDKLEEMVTNFFELNYEYEQDYCPHRSCCTWANIMTSGTAETGIYANDAWYCDRYYHGCKEIREWYDKDVFTGEWLWDNKITGIRSFCDRKHNYLKGEVKIYSLNDVMSKLNLTDEEKDMYEIYYQAINEWLAEE